MFVGVKEMSLQRYLKLNELGGSFSELYFNVREGVPCSAFGVQFSQKCHIASALDIPVLYITSTAMGAKQAAEEISELTDRRVVYLGAKDDVLPKRMFEQKFSYGPAEGEHVDEEAFYHCRSLYYDMAGLDQEGHARHSKVVELDLQWAEELVRGNK